MAGALQAAGRQLRGQGGRARSTAPSLHSFSAEQIHGYSRSPPPPFVFQSVGEGNGRGAPFWFGKEGELLYLEREERTEGG